MKRSRRDDLLLFSLLALILALAAGIRFYALGSQSLWSDEGNSAALAARSLSQIAQDARGDIHPPLYYWLLSIWTRYFGNSEMALRSLSAIFGVLLVWVIAELGRRLFSPITGLAAGFIAALAPFQVYYSQEARMYILLALEAALAMLLFWHYLKAQENAEKTVHAAHCRRFAGGHLDRRALHALFLPHHHRPANIALPHLALAGSRNAHQRETIVAMGSHARPCRVGLFTVGAAHLSPDRIMARAARPARSAHRHRFRLLRVDRRPGGPVARREVGAVGRGAAGRDRRGAVAAQSRDRVACDARRCAISSRPPGR